MILLARQLNQRLLAGVAQHLTRVELAKVDCLRSIAVGFRPGLRHFINHPGG